MLTTWSYLLCGALQLNKSKLYSVDFPGPSPIWTSNDMINHANYLCESYYEQSGGDELLPDIMNLHPEERCRALFLDADRVLLSHGIQQKGEGPILNYGNMAGLKLWSASWEQLTTMPSKLTAEPMNQESRDMFMRTVTSRGIVKGYEGVRISLNKKRRFTIRNAVVWNIIIGDQHIGQAATFRESEVKYL